MTDVSSNSPNAGCPVSVSLGNKLFFAYSILYAGGSIAFFHTIAGTVSLFLGALLLAFLNFLNISANLLISIGIWFLYFIGSSIAIGSFHPFFMVEIPVAMFSAYVIIQTLGHKCIGLFVQTVYCLTAISIPLFVLQAFFPHVILPVLHSFNMQGVLFSPDIDCGSIILYSYNILIDNPQIRNCGFCWEPGAFASFCIMALVLNYYFEVKKSFKVNLVLLIGLLTTFSTTGYCIFFLCVSASVLCNKKIRTKLFLIPVVLVLFHVMLNSDFLWEKINDQIKTMDFETYIENSVSYGSHYSPGRFSSFLLAWKNFTLRPIFGYAGNTELEYSAQNKASIAIISGWGLLIARYGLCGLSLFLYLLCRSGFYWNKFKIKADDNFFISWLILQAGIMVSYKLFLSPIFFVFFFFPLFAQSNVNSSGMMNSANSDGQSPEPELS